MNYNKDLDNDKLKEAVINLQSELVSCKHRLTTIQELYNKQQVDFDDLKLRHKCLEETLLQKLY